MSFININIKGLNEAIEYFDKAPAKLRIGCLAGLETSARILTSAINKENPMNKYEYQINENVMAVWIAPSPTTIKDERLQKRSRQIWKYRKCPFWKDLVSNTFFFIEGLVFEPNIEDIFLRLESRIISVIVETIRQSLCGV